MAPGRGARGRSLVFEDAAVAASEYVLLLGLTVLLLFVVVRVYGRQLSAQWAGVSTQLFGGQVAEAGGTGGGGSGAPGAGGARGNGKGGNGRGSSGKGNFGCNSNAGKC